MSTKTDGAALTGELQSTKTYFERTIGCFEESDSDFRPQPELYSVAQHVAHTAQTVEWFLEGAFRPEGFDMDFDKHIREAKAVTSLRAARAWMERAFAAAEKTLASKSAEELAEPLPADGIMAGAPRSAIVGAIVDHSAHHRGALSVYARLAGKTPAMPYA